MSYWGLSKTSIMIKLYIIFTLCSVGSAIAMLGGCTKSETIVVETSDDNSSFLGEETPEPDVAPEAVLAQLNEKIMEAKAKQEVLNNLIDRLDSMLKKHGDDFKKELCEYCAKHPDSKDSIRDALSKKENIPGGEWLVSYADRYAGTLIRLQTAQGILSESKRTIFEVETKRDNFEVDLQLKKILPDRGVSLKQTIDAASIALIDLTEGIENLTPDDVNQSVLENTNYLDRLFSDATNTKTEFGVQKQENVEILADEATDNFVSSKLPILTESDVSADKKESGNVENDVGLDLPIELSSEIESKLVELENQYKGIENVCLKINTLYKELEKKLALNCQQLKDTLKSKTRSERNKIGRAFAEHKIPEDVQDGGFLLGEYEDLSRQELSIKELKRRVDYAKKAKDSVQKELEEQKCLAKKNLGALQDKITFKKVGPNSNTSIDVPKELEEINNLVLDALSVASSKLTEIQNCLDREYSMTSEEKQTILTAYLKSLFDDDIVLRATEWEEGEAGDRRVIDVDGIEYAFRFCPTGSYVIGSPVEESGRDEDERQHNVKLSSYWILETEVTQNMWKDVMGNNPANHQGDNLPVEKVSWDDCQVFIDKLNEKGIAPDGWSFSLPTEAEWEVAARGGSATAYSWGESWDCSRGNCLNCGPRMTMNVGCFPANDWGIVDMSGNVWEWCLDTYDNYLKTVDNDPVAQGNSVCVIRGGGWNSNSQSCRLANRNSLIPTHCIDNLGFRCVLVLTSVRQ